MANEFKNSNEEIDIIALFDYFKRGFESLFSWIKKLILYLFSGLIFLLLHIKKNLLIIVGAAFLGLAAWFVQPLIIPKPYVYEMKVKPTSFLKQSLYNTVNSINTKVQEKQNHSYGKAITKILVKPVKSSKASHQLYRESLSLQKENNKLDANWDSIFVANNPYHEFVKNLDDFQFRTHKIQIFTKEPINTKEWQKQLLSEIENNQKAKRLLEAKIKSLHYKQNALENSLVLIDTLILSTAKRKLNTDLQSDILLSNQNAKANLETDLLQASAVRIQEISEIQYQIEETKSLVTVISNLNLITPKKHKFNSPLGYTLFPVLLVLIFTLLPHLGKLNKEDDSTQSQHNQ